MPTSRRVMPWDEESHAAEVLVAIHRGKTIRRDPGGGPFPIHNFDLHLDDGRVIAVDVTRYNVQAELRQRAEAARNDRRYPALTLDWHLSV